MNFNDILFSEIKKHEDNYSKLPKLARAADGSYYLKEA